MRNKENEKIMKENTCRSIVTIPIDLDQSFRLMAKREEYLKVQ